MMASGIKRRLIPSDVGVIKPRPTLKGTLNRLSTRKNQAAVPINKSFGKRSASRYITITGPAALATMVVNPANKPATPTSHGRCADPLSPALLGLRCARRARWIAIRPSRMPPIRRRTPSSAIRFSANAPITTPTAVHGNKRNRWAQLTSRRYAATATTSPAISVTSTAPTDSRAGRTLAKIATAKIPIPAIPVLERPIRKAPRPARSHCHHVTS